MQALGLCNPQTDVVRDATAMDIIATITGSSLKLVEHVAARPSRQRCART